MQAVVSALPQYLTAHKCHPRIFIKNVQLIVVLKCFFVPLSVKMFLHSMKENSRISIRSCFEELPMFITSKAGFCDGYVPNLLSFYPFDIFISFLIPLFISLILFHTNSDVR